MNTPSTERAKFRILNLCVGAKQSYGTFLYWLCDLRWAQIWECNIFCTVFQIHSTRPLLSIRMCFLINQNQAKQKGRIRLKRYQTQRKSSFRAPIMPVCETIHTNAIRLLNAAPCFCTVNGNGMLRRSHEKHHYRCPWFRASRSDPKQKKSGRDLHGVHKMLPLYLWSRSNIRYSASAYNYTPVCSSSGRNAACSSLWITSTACTEINY